ncbi:small ribosomal subunit protein mS39 isoform X2 [Mus musculus]|uniref:small ribosomal subunit protein mS39 isoform X2 n=1 Tax=Mus musculus TaxID=10090 RepID=UPI0005AB9C1E|nr:pentatricopeptide repeat domain-containing protein 3, mitochondrial isoform X2 [Mus musculus]|eukprot:XP_011239763.1 PREDICTED: pentatricopeptide repeat domain-containing protein 3, mitochondrial isoform X3 [Mus musculus]
MAAAAVAARRLSFRSGLVLLQTTRGTGVCEPKVCCRFYAGTESLPKVEGSDITGIEEIVIPKKKTWDKVAVLQALASTVNRDPTAAPYVFHDDPYLIPTSALESRSFLLAKKSGETAAKFIINSYPKYFQKDIAEPHIPCLMPEYFEPQIEDVSEAALEERIRLRKVRASVDMFDQLLQAGTTVSLETTNSLLDLLCYYGDQEPPADYPFQQTEHLENLEEAAEENNQTSKMESGPWKAQNNAERIFALMPEKNARSYCTMIRGMVKVPFFVYLYLIFFETGSLCNLNWMDEHTRLKLLKMSQPHYRYSTIPGKKNSFSLFRHISEIVCPALRLNKTSQNNWDPGHTLQYLVVILRNIFVSLCCLQPVK